MEFATLWSLESKKSGSLFDKSYHLYSGNSMIYTFAFEAVLNCKARSTSIGDSKTNDNAFGHGNNAERWGPCENEPWSRHNSQKFLYC